MATILNLARLDRKLKRLPGVAIEEIRTAMETAAEDIVALARSLVPKDTHNLEKSIGWTWGAPPRGSLTLGKLARSALGKDLTITIYAGDEFAYYARWVEFGTRAAPARGPKRNSRYRSIFAWTRSYKAHHATAAKPFFYPAYRANRKRVKSRIRRAVRVAGKKAAGQ